MSYKTAASSPFLTTSLHHYHNTHSNSPSYYPHYHTNSYTNTYDNLSHHIKPTQYNQSEKYFPKEFIQVLPGISNLPPLEEDQLVNPLNTYSGNLTSSYHSLIHSPFNRGEIYYGKKDPALDSISSKSDSSYKASTFINQLQYSSDLKQSISSNDINKKENPFYKKYLLSQKNKQLQNIAMYSSSYFSQSQNSYINNKYSNERNARKLESIGKYDYPYERQLNQQQLGQGMLKLAKKYGNQNKNKNGYNKSSENLVYDSVKQARNQYGDENRRNNIDNYQRFGKALYNDLVQSDVDQKQFNSFGQGKDKYQFQQSKEYQGFDKFQKRNQNFDAYRKDKETAGQSIINGLTKMISSSSKNQNSNKNINLKQKNGQKNVSIQQPQQSRRRPAYIEQQDDDDIRRSGSFKIPQAVIDQINNQRLSSSIQMPQKKRKESAGMNYQQQSIDRQKAKYTRQQYVQAYEKNGQKSSTPNQIILRGKVYEKLPVS